MSEQISAVDFEIKGEKLQKEIFLAFAQAQAMLLGLHGFVEETATGVKGRLEGTKEKVKKLQEVIKAANQFSGQVKDYVFSEAQDIAKFTYDNFIVKK